MAQIFDESLAQTLYQRVLSGDATAIHPLMEHCIPLAEVVAANLAYNGHSHLFDDMVQEGLLKVYEICVNRKYDPSKAKLFSFLNTTLRNIMIDVTRKEVNYLHGETYTPASLDEPVRPACSITMGETLPAPEQEQPEWNPFRLPARWDALYGICQEYAAARFPSLHPAVAADAADYAVTAVVECRTNDVLHTLEIFYNINRKQAYTFYHAVQVRLRLAGNDEVCYEADAVRLAQQGKNEWSMLPEIVLISGEWTAEPLLEYMTGTYVRFISL